MFGSWSQKCAHCANYSGSQQAAGFCRVWGTVLSNASALSQQCPHWTHRDAVQRQAPTCALLRGG